MPVTVPDDVTPVSLPAHGPESNPMENLRAPLRGHQPGRQVRDTGEAIVRAWRVRPGVPARSRAIATRRRARVDAARVDAARVDARAGWR